MTEVSIKSIDEVTQAILSAKGVDEDSIEVILDTIHYANRRGVATHGVGRLPLYVRKIEAGHLNPQNNVECILDADAVSVFDAHNGFGQVSADLAIRTCIQKAKKYGIAIAGVRNSNNFGTAGYFGSMAANEGMGAIIFANAAPASAPTGGNKAVLGTNPLCMACPGNGDIPPVVLDMATTIAARGKIRLAAKTGEKIPMDWAKDANGSPTDDPIEALKGTLLPIAGYKGYGLSLFVDMFAGLLTGSAYAGGVKPLSDMGHSSGNGHLFIVFDVKHFMSEEEYQGRLKTLVDTLKASGDDVLLPGERGSRESNLHDTSVKMSQKQIDEINEVARSLGLSERLEIVA